MKKNIVNSIKINIGIDLDGVIIDHTQNKIKIAESLKFKIKAKETQSEVLKKFLPKDKYIKLQKIIYNEITLNAPPMFLVFKTLENLSKNYKLFIISKRENNKSGLAWNWLKKYKIFKIIPKENIIFVTTAEDKNFWCKKLNIKIYLDDKIGILDILYSVPYKIFFNPHKILHNKKYLEINSWQEFPKLLKELEKTIFK